MKRQEWTVPYTGEQLASAAAEKKGHHAGRQKWWAEKKDQVVAQIKESGITVTDSIVDELGKQGYSTSNAGRGPIVQIDAALQSHLVEAQEKMKQHERTAREFDAWHQMMSAHKTASFNLTQADWMFFFGK